MCTRRDALRSAAATSGALCAMTSGRSRKLWWPAGRSPTLLHSRPLREWGGGGALSWSLRMRQDVLNEWMCVYLHVHSSLRQPSNTPSSLLLMTRSCKTGSLHYTPLDHRLITLRNGIGNAISIPIQRNVSS